MVFTSRLLSGQYLKQRTREGQPKGRAIRNWEGSESLVLRIILKILNYLAGKNLSLILYFLSYNAPSCVIQIA